MHALGPTGMGLRPTLKEDEPPIQNLRPDHLHSCLQNGYY